jgi:malonyl-CoA/methylmalonyl-CoA synthetase
MRYLERGRPSSTAVRDARGAWTYGELAREAEAAAARLGVSPGERVGLALERTRESLALLLGAFHARAVVVPLSPKAAPREIAHQIADAGVSRVVGLDAAPAPRSPGPEEGGLILHTSGTTGTPKGVLHTHASLASQINILHDAWEWSPGDRLLHALPLHHIHGLVNGVLGALRAGAELRFLPAFAPDEVWRSFAAREASVFYAVPTMYHQLAEAWESRDAADRLRLSEAAGALRLAVSGSAALPARLWNRWRELSGQTLLERYGMTEIGMALSNPYRGERRPGTVGRPLPGMEVRLDERGEILVRGPSLFREYWGRPEATREAFVDGWFKTGDVAELSDGYVAIRGRASIDIIKSAGYKISALEIEAALLEHPSVAEAAVVGVPDVEWGEVVTAVLVPKPGGAIDDLRDWCRERLAPYKTPRRWVTREALPRNAMGKVTKPELRRELSGR